MKRSLTPTVTTLEDRLALSTTSPTIVVAPAPMTGAITTLTPTVTPIQSSVLDAGGTLEWLAESNAPVIIPLNSGTGQTFHFVTIITNEQVVPSESDPLRMLPTVPVALATAPLTFSPVSSLS